jgi:outer membrane putative beta-barrel porin/alpha-amylase
MQKIILRYIVLISIQLLFCIQFIYAGPPYDTDDPQPVDFHHWEIYWSSIGLRNSYAAMGTLPHLEVNYGVIPNVQLHVIAPLSFYKVAEGKTNYGYGDTEFGVKCRFINKDSGNFQVGIFPLVEAPTGNSNENLGNGKAQVYLPLWIQGTIGKWSTYGGGGYWINPGTGNKNYEFIGWQAQYQFVKSVSIGAEIYDVTASQVGGSNDFRFRIGSIIDFNDHNHLLFSIGRSISGNVNLQWYFGYQITF